MDQFFSAVVPDEDDELQQSAARVETQPKLAPGVVVVEG
jgi:hypothetical protein